MIRAIGGVVLIAIVVALGAGVLLWTVRPATTSQAGDSSPTLTIEGPGPSPDVRATREAAESRSPTSEPTMTDAPSSAGRTPTPSAASPVTPPPDIEPVLAASDLFWGPMHGRLLYDWEFGSLSETTAAVDLVVVGRIVSVYVGRTVGTDGDRIPMAWMDVSVDEVLKGEPQSRKEGIISIELEPTIEPGWDKILANVPEHQHVFFLMNEEQHRFREALPPFDAQLDRYTYFRPNDQAVLRLVSGRLWLIEPDQLTRGRYPSELQGQPFSDVRAAILASVADSDSP